MSATARALPAQAPSGEHASRRAFFGLAGLGGLLALVAGTLVNTLRYFVPNKGLLFEPPTRFKVGFPNAFPYDSTVLLREERIIINRDARGRFTAARAECTHLGCIPQYNDGTRTFQCPCHGSLFARDGAVLSGPAPRPLDRVSITLDRKGQLLVDRARPVDRDYFLPV